MARNQEKSFICEVCKQAKAPGGVFPLAIVNESVFKMIQRDHPEVHREGWICSSDLNN